MIVFVLLAMSVYLLSLIACVAAVKSDSVLGRPFDDSSMLLALVGSLLPVLGAIIFALLSDWRLAPWRR